MKDNLKPGQALNQLQNDLLLLFLKYKLAFRSNIKELEEMPVPESTFRSILIHSMFHAVFGNNSGNDPYLDVQIKKGKAYLELEICSTGDATTFTSSIHTYCHDHFFYKYTSVEFHAFDVPALAAVDVQQRSLYGSIIRFMFFYT